MDYTVQSATDYYPYGKALRSYGKERYQSTYHERDVESGFDYRGARFYDGETVRFNSLDPLAAEFPEWSDYNYVLGNPIVFIDPNGKRTIYYNEDGQEIHRSEDELDDAIVIISNENLKAFYAEWGDDIVCSSECETYFNSDKVNERLRGLGMNYMVADMIEVLNYGYSLGTTTDYTLNYQTQLIDANTGKVIPLYPEIAARLELSENKVSLANRDFTVGGPGDVALPVVFPSVHSHTNGFIPKEKIKFKYPNGKVVGTKIGFGGSPGAPPSENNDQETAKLRIKEHNNPNVRDAVISPTHIFLYNGSPAHNVKAPLSFFNYQNNKK